MGTLCKRKQMSLKYSIQIPMRCQQEGYRKVIDTLEAQTIRHENFELIIANDCVSINPIEPIKTSFKQRIVRIPDRLPGWAYSIGRNVCMDYGTPTSEYLVHIDADWLLIPETLANSYPLLSNNTILRGWKKYQDGRFRMYPEMFIAPTSAVKASGGWDEVFFPWYGGSFHDMMRRLQKAYPVELKDSDTFYANCVGTDVKYKRVYDVNKKLIKQLANLGTKKPIMRGTTATEVVYEQGY